MVRLQQRGKSKEGVKMVMRYGVSPGGKDGVMLRRRDAETEINRRKRWLLRLGDSERHKWLRKALRRRIKTLELMRGCIVVHKEDRIITVYNRTRKRLRGR